jgi:hypothetical protein
MGTLHICRDMSAGENAGDQRLSWDKTDPAIVAAVKAQFDALLASNHLAYKKMDGPVQGELIRTFDPDAETITIVPPIQAG